MKRPRACMVRQVDKLEVALLRDSEALVAAGYEVDIVMMRPPEASHWGELPPGVTVRTLALRRRKGGLLGYVGDYLSFVVAASFLVAWLHLRRRYRVVHIASLPDVLVVAGLVPKVTGAALVLKVAEPTPQLSETLGHPPWLTALLGWLQVTSARVADAVVTVTDELADDLARRGVERSSIAVVLNVPGDAMASLRGDHRPDPDRFTVICHGSILERYGHDTILEAAAILRSDVPELRVVFTGTEPYWEILRQRVPGLGLVGVVEHHAWLPLPDLVALVQRADVGVVAQKASPYSHLVNTTKMFEFLMLGVPVVCSRLRATERLVPADAGAIRYFEPDDAQQLAAVLLELRNDPQARAELAERGQELYASLGTATQREAYLGAVGHALRRRRGDDGRALRRAQRGFRRQAQRRHRTWPGSKP